MLPPAAVSPSVDAGVVRLVGARPDDSLLLALHALAKAEIILHDARVPGEDVSLALHAQLVEAGSDPADAVALIQDAARPGRAAGITTLTDVADQTVSLSPVLTVIGPVASSRDQLAAWQQTASMKFVDDRQQARIAG
jgi:siroheme synthase